MAARKSEKEARNKARNHDLLLKALKARRDARARHSNFDLFRNNPGKLPDD